jgi:hypothetical protein
LRFASVHCFKTIFYSRLAAPVVENIKFNLVELDTTGMLRAICEASALAGLLIWKDSERLLIDGGVPICEPMQALLEAKVLRVFGVDLHKNLLGRMEPDTVRFSAQQAIVAVAWNSSNVVVHRTTGEGSTVDGVAHGNVRLPGLATSRVTPTLGDKSASRVKRAHDDNRGVVWVEVVCGLHLVRFVQSHHLGAKGMGGCCCGCVVAMKGEDTKRRGEVRNWKWILI